MTTALITGISGQDGSHLAEHLLQMGYEVIGMVRRQTGGVFGNIAHIQSKVTLVEGDVTDQRSVEDILEKFKPSEVYNLAAQSFAPTSVSRPFFTSMSTALGAASVLDAISRVHPKARFFQASSSEMFGEPVSSPQDERTTFRPRNPYGVAKLYGHYITKYYREHRGVFACSGIMYNHESPRRGEEFVTRKITLGVAKIKLGLQRELRLGNLSARRDWGYAGDFVKAMQLILSSDEPGDYVISSGKAHSVYDLCEAAFGAVNLEAGDYIVVDPDFYRPDENFVLLGNSTKIKEELGWRAETDFQTMIKMMVINDIEKVKMNGKPKS